MKTDAQKRAINKWRATKMHRVAIDYTLADYDEVKAAADAVGIPVVTFCREAVKDKIKRVTNAPS